jgi:hypothetical protein
VVVGEVSDVSDVHAASIFRVDVCRLCGQLCVYPYHAVLKIDVEGEMKWGLVPRLCQ